MRFWVEHLWTAGMTGAEPGPWQIDTDGPTITDVDKVDSSTPDSVLAGVVLPGLIDMHEHIGIDVGDEHAQSVQPAGRMLLVGARNLRTMLDAGVTTIRDCGERPDVERFWAEAVADGVIPGPRIVRSVAPICRTGGHAWYLGQQTDGVDALRARVREHLRAGADFIKIMVSGGIGTVGSDQGLAEYTDEEVRAVVAEAHRLGLRVAAHGHGGLGVDYAIAAGVDTIEHGVLLTDEQLSAMADKGITLVMTNAVFEEFAVDPRVPAEIRSFMPGFVHKMNEMVVRARRSGVTVTAGTDAVHGAIWREIAIMIAHGYSPVEALEAVTRNAAQALGREDLGALRAGASADLLVVAADPTQHPDTLTNPTAVMARGQWHRQ